MSKTILVVDDEAPIRELLQYNLEKEGFRVLTASNGTDALQRAQEHPDLILLDVMMPGMDGWEVCKAIRKNPATAHIAVVFLTARESEVDEVLGLELGADEYLVKSGRMRTLVARLRKLLTRTSTPESKASTSAFLETAGLRIHINNYVVTIDGEDVSFPKKEFEVLVYLARHPDRVISRGTLLNEVWGPDVFVVDRTVDVHVRKIREKLGAHAGLIETVKGVGYRFAGAS